VFLQTVDQRLASVEDDLRRRLESLAADVDAQRAVLEARLHELGRRVAVAEEPVRSP
jgi:frataxin-like iron-binding protein CyaY